MLNTAFSPWPSYTDEEVQAVGKVLLSNKVNYWTGQECRMFETEFATWAGCAHAVALGHGTPALDEIGRASWRERVCQYVERSGAAVSLKIKYAVENKRGKIKKT